MSDEAEPPFRAGMIVSPHPHAPLHLRTFEALEQVETIEVCGIEGLDPVALSRDSTKVRATTTDPGQLVARPDLDAVLVCARNDLCPAILEAAVRAGKPVLFEKPGAVRAADLRPIAALARERGVPLGTIFQRRGHPMIEDVRQVVRGGALGRVMAVEARMVTSQVRYRDPAHWLFGRDTAGSGILSWLACHHLDLLCYLLAEPIAQVAAIVGRRNPEPIEVEDTACLAFRFASGVMGTLHAGYLLAGSVPGYEGGAYDSFVALRGTAGFVRLPLSEGNTYTLLSEAPGWDTAGKRERSFTLPPSRAYGGKAGEALVLDFLRTARSGGTPLCPIDAAVHVLEVVDAALESACSGRLVQLAGR